MWKSVQVSNHKTFPAGRMMVLQSRFFFLPCVILFHKALECLQIRARSSQWCKHEWSYAIIWPSRQNLDACIFRKKELPRHLNTYPSSLLNNIINSYDATIMILFFRLLIWYLLTIRWDSHFLTAATPCIPFPLFQIPESIMNQRSPVKLKPCG